MRRALSAARWALGIGAVALLLAGFDASEVLARLSRADVGLAAVGVVGLTAVHVLSAAAWRLLVEQASGSPPSWRTSLRVYYAAQALGGVTPGNVGGDAYRVLVARRSGLGWHEAVAPVIGQRATSYLALALLAVPALAWLALWARPASPVVGAGLVLAALAGGVALLVLLAPRRVHTLLSRLSVTKLATASPGTASGGPSLRSIGAATALGLGFHLASVLLTGLLVVAVDPQAASPSVLAAIVVARLSLAIPILPSGLGANEAMLAVLFVGLGQPPQAALAALLLTRVALVLTTLIGAGLMVGGKAHDPGGALADGQLPVSTR